MTVRTGLADPGDDDDDAIHTHVDWSDYDDLSRLEQLALLPEDEANALIAGLTEEDLNSPDMTLRPSQISVVDEPAWIAILAAGRGTGKTKTGAQWAIKRAHENPGCIIALLGRTVSDVRDVMIQGESGILAESPSDFMPTYVPSLRKLTWPNGSTAMTYSSDAPNQLRGPQQHFLWADEIAAFRMAPDDSGATAWDNALLSTRLGEHPQLLATTTPKRVNLVRELFQQAKDPTSGVKLHTASTMANRANLSEEYIRAIHDRYAGTHLERQELYGELIGASPGAMWRESDIRVKPLPDDLEVMYLIGVDPAITKHGDDTGIVVVAGTMDPDPMHRQAWIVEDLTFQGGPEEWAPVIIEAQAKYTARTPSRPCIVVVEGNQGGELLNMVLHQINPALPVARVQALRSKAARAEPVVMAYRQKRVWHVEEFSDLTDELTGWEPDVSKWSPGHLDALVWGCSAMLVDSKPLWPFAPVLVGEMPSGQIGSAVPPYRRGQPKPGMALAPWRGERQPAAPLGWQSLSRR